MPPMSISILTAIAAQEVVTLSIVVHFWMDVKVRYSLHEVHKKGVDFLYFEVLF